MARQSFYNEESHSHYQLPAPSFDHESKAHYDDLTDDHGVPFQQNSRHQTFNVDPQAMYNSQHQRSPSYPLQKSYSMKLSDASSSHLPAYPPPPVNPEVDTRSLWQRILPESLACRLYVLVVIVETIIDLSIEADLLMRVNRALDELPADQRTKGKEGTQLPAYLSVFALAHIFQLIMAVDAVRNRNTLQFICLAVFNAIFLMYSIIQINEVDRAVRVASTGVTNIPINVLTQIIPVVIAIAEVAYIGLGWKIYNEFGWKVYKFLGADRRIKKMYTQYQIYECLVKFDVFFWTGFSVQFIYLVLKDNDWEYYVTIAALPLSLILLVEGHLAARHENKMMMLTFMSGCVGALVYFVYKLARVVMNKNVEPYSLIAGTLSTFSVIAIILLVCTFIFSVIVLRNFGRGLKAAISKSKKTVAAPEPGNPHRRVASATLNRMSIS